MAVSFLSRSGWKTRLGTRRFSSFLDHKDSASPFSKRFTSGGSVGATRRTRRSPLGHASTIPSRHLCNRKCMMVRLFCSMGVFGMRHIIRGAGTVRPYCSNMRLLERRSQFRSSTMSNGRSALPLRLLRACSFLEVPREAAWFHHLRPVRNTHRRSAPIYTQGQISLRAWMAGCLTHCSVGRPPSFLQWNRTFRC